MPAIPFNRLGIRDPSYADSFGPGKHACFDLFCTHICNHRAITWSRYQEDPFDMYEGTVVFLAGERSWRSNLTCGHLDNGPGWHLTGAGHTLNLPYRHIRDVVSAGDVFAVNHLGTWYETVGLVPRRVQQSTTAQPATIYDERT